MPHIPSGTTQEAGVMTFEEALAPTGREEYDRSRWIYVPDSYSEYRYLLGTVGENPLIAVGINPSTAAPGDLDPTLKSVERIALANGYDSFLMFNVYAQRATDPDRMEEVCNPLLHRENMKAFEYILARAASSGRSPSVWAAWGTIIEKRAYLPLCVADMIGLGRRYGARWFSCGARSKAGHPHHPLYLRRDARLESFDAAGYLEALLRK